MKTKVNDTRFPRLTRAVLRRLDRDQLFDVCNHGASGGFPGFTYYTDTVAFYKAHKADILAMAQSDASGFGMGMLEIVKGFNCLNGDYSVDEIGEALYSGRGDGSTQVRNAMAWYALESVARELNPGL